AGQAASAWAPETGSRSRRTSRRKRRPADASARGWRPGPDRVKARVETLGPPGPVGDEGDQRGQARDGRGGRGVLAVGGPAEVVAGDTDGHGGAEPAVLGGAAGVDGGADRV